MFPLMMPMLIGAGLGLLTNKKKPLEGALLGAALGAGGAAAGGGLLGAEAAAAPAYTGTAAELAADGLGGVSMMPEAGASLMGTLKQAKPFMDAAGTGMQVAQQFDQPQQPIQPSPMMPPPVNNGVMNALMQNLGTQQAQTFDEDAKRRARRQSLLG